VRSIDYFDRGAEIAPDRAAIVEGDEQLTFAEVQALTHKIAKAMYANGLTLQAPVALYSPNHASVMLCLLSIWRASGVWIPVNTRNAIDANVAYLNYVRCEWLFYHSSLATDVAQLKAQVPTLIHCVCLDKPLDGDPSLDAFIASGEGHPWTEQVDAFGNLNELVGIFPTGGTTGPSKGVNVTNLGWGTMLETAMRSFAVPADVKPVCLTVAPITHAAGPVATATMGLGATNVILPGFDAGAVLDAIERHKITHMYLPPTALYGLLDHPRVRETDVSSLKVFLLVGSPVSPDKLREAVGIFGPCMCQCYGQVEAPMIVTWLPQNVVAAAAAGDHPERLASCGRSTDSVRVGIMDDDGNLMPVGERGEIVVRGALVSHSYFEKPEATEEVRTFGWHHTGDVGYRDKDGFIYIVDRKKDMIITGGFNVFSAEVEAGAMELPEVRECAVIGVPDEKWGEAIRAIVVPAAGASITPEQVIAHLRKRLGGVKAPKAVEFWDAIPRTPAGKMDKKAIRAKYWGSSDRNVH